MERLGEEGESAPRACQSEELDSKPCSAAYSCETVGESFNPQALVLSSTNMGAVMRTGIWVSQGPSRGWGEGYSLQLRSAQTVQPDRSA